MVRHGGKTAPIDAQTVVLPDKSRVSAFVAVEEGDGGTENVDGRLVTQIDEDCKTMYDVLRRGVKKSGSKPAIGARTGERNGLLSGPPKREHP